MKSSEKNILECKCENIISQLRAENKKYKIALDKLSRLGNEPELGNSDGNIIAQQALKDEVMISNDKQPTSPPADDQNVIIAIKVKK